MQVPSSHTTLLDPIPNANPGYTQSLHGRQRVPADVNRGVRTKEDQKVQWEARNATKNGRDKGVQQGAR